MEIFWNIIIVFITFDQFKASLLNKSINLYNFFLKKNKKKTTQLFYIFIIIIMIKMFLEQQISILEWFLKDHVKLKTGVMMLKIQLWSQE